MTRLSPARLVPIALVALAALGAYACSDSTGPDGGSRPHVVAITVHPVFPSEAAKQVVQFDRIRVKVTRTSGQVALDTTIIGVPSIRQQADLAANTASILGSGIGDITVNVPLASDAPSSGEDFTIELTFLNGTTVLFHGGPIGVHAGASGSASVNISTQYQGTGSTAASVAISPTSVNVTSGASVNFTARALDGSGVEIPGTPMQWTSLDAFATVPDVLVGHVVAGTARGTARIRATLPNGVFGEATIVITPVATAIARESGNAQSAAIGNALPQPLVVKATASDGGPAAGVSVTFSAGGSGTLSNTQVTTGANGLATTTYTCSLNVGQPTITATATGLSGSPVSFAASCTAGTVSQLSFTSQPANVVAGATLNTITVEALDQFGNRATDYTGLVTLGLDNPPAGVALQGTFAASAVAGVATFTNVSVSNAANSQRLTATGAGVAGVATSAAFTISPRPATALAFATQIGNAAQNEALPSVVIQARDAVGNIVTTFNGAVTVALDNAPGATLQGALTVNAVNGVATFAGLSVSAQAAAARLAATAAGIAGTFFSNNFVVGPPANPLTATPPSASFSVQRTAASPAPLVVQLASLSAQVTGLAVGTITYGAGATGWLAAVLGATTTSTTLTLTPTTPALPAGTFTATVPITANAGISLFYSVTLTVTPMPVTQIVMFTQPAGATSGINFVTQPVVELRDATGTIVTTASNAVTVSIGSGSGVLSGTLTRSPSNGRVTFTDLRITGTGAHTLAFNATGLTGATSASFNVGAALSTTQAVATTSGTTGTAIAPFTPVTAAGGTPPYTFALSGGALPTGMSFNTTTGSVGGTPTTVLAATNFTVTVTDNVGSTSAKTFQLTVNAGLTTTVAAANIAGTVNTAIPTTTPVTASGGTAPLTFALSGGALPTGMSFNTTNGQLSGTPTTTLATTAFTVTVTDNVGATSAKNFNLTVNVALATTQAVATTAGTQGTLIPTFTPVTASGGTTPYTFALSGGTLPTGMSFNTTTGAVSGTPTSALVATTFTVTVTDAATATSSKTFQLTVNPTLTTTQAVATTTGTQGTPISFTPVTAAGGTAPLTFALSGGSLPAGMGFNTTNGLVSGTPTAPLVQTTFTVTVTDFVGATSNKTFQLTVNGPLTTTQAVPTKVGTVGAAIASFVPVTASGGTTPYTYALSGGSLPTGMSFNTTTGAVSGTPTTTLVQTTFTVTVTDFVAATSSKTFDLTVNAALTTTQAVASTVGTVNTAIPTFTPVTSAGGTVPHTFALSGGALPTGMNFNTSNGQVSGTPTTTLAQTTFTVTVTDAANATSNKTFQLTVNGALTTTQAIASRTGTQNTAITTFTPVTATGGTTPYTFALSGGSLPTGMNFNTTNGQVSGTPTTTLTQTTFTVTVTDNAGATSAKTFDLTVNTALTTTQAVATKVGTLNTLIPTFTPVTAAGGTAPLTFALSGGTLPTGMSFNTSTGAVSGTPTTVLANTAFTVTVTDNVGATSAKNFNLTVNSALTTTQAVASTVGTQGVALSFTPVTTAGGTAPVTFALTGGALPSGVAFNTTNGLVSGTPTASLTLTTFTVTVTDAASATSSKTFDLTVNGPLSANQAVATKSGTINTAIASFVPVTGNGGTAPYTFALTVGTLPTGMSFNTTTGAVSGTPTATLATASFTVQITDAALATAQNTFQLTVNGALTTTQAVPTTIGTVNTAIPSFTPVTASGGTTPYQFALSGGSLPSGMSFSTTTGAVSGTPTATLAQTTFTVTVTDNAGATSNKTFQLTVNSALTTTQAVASITTNSGTAISSTVPVTAAGGTTPYTYALSGGSLPTGLNFSTTTGTLSGTPTTTIAATTFTVTVTDNAGATSAKTFQLTVNATLATTQAVPTTAGTVNIAIPSFIPVTASGGTAPLTFALSGGSLPTGMSFSTTTGQVSGTPTTTLTATVFTVTVTDNISATSAKTFSLTVNSAVSTTQAVATTTTTQGTPLSFTPVTATGGTAPLTFALSGGSLPTGVNFNTTNGLVSGTPSTSLAQTTFTVTVTDNVGSNSAKTFQLTVNGPLSAVQSIPSTTLQTVAATQPVITPFTPVTASGGTAPYTYAITSGTLPTGLSFNTSTGQITGRPGAALIPTATFTVQVTDNIGATASTTFDLTVNGIFLDLTTNPNPVAVNANISIPVVVDLSNRGTDDIASIALSISWDPTKFSFVSTSAGLWTDSQGNTASPNVNTGNAGSGSISISGTTPNATFATFTLRTITLKALVAGPATVSAAFTPSPLGAGTEDGRAIVVTPKNVTVTITP